MTEETALAIRTDPDTRRSLEIAAKLEPLKGALNIANLDDGEIKLFAMVAAHTGLDPFTKQIYAIKRGNRVTHQTGIDGYRSTAERTGQYRGSDPAEFESCDCGGKIDGKDDSPPDHPKLARVTVYRAYPDGIRGQVGVARWHELKPAHVANQSGGGFQDDMWWRMPHNQLAKCAEAAGLRQAFPRVLGGVYITEEMQQADIIEGEAREVPNVEDRLAARRAKAESAKTAPTSTEPRGDEPEAAGATSTAPGADGAPDLTEGLREQSGEAEPAGLTWAEFQRMLRERSILPGAVAPIAKQLFPDAAGVKELTDQERFTLWERITEQFPRP